MVADLSIVIPVALSSNGSELLSIPPDFLLLVWFLIFVNLSRSSMAKLILYFLVPYLVVKVATLSIMSIDLKFSTYSLIL